MRCPEQILAGVLALAATSAGAQQPAPHIDYLDGVERQIVDYVSDLADLHCTEKVTQQKLDKGGHAESTEKSEFDYLIMMSGTGDDFEINESRREIATRSRKAPAQPMLVSNGIATVLLVFHPYYRSSFEFSLGPQQLLDDRPAVPIRFRHVPGGRTPLALALRDREFPIEMTGTAWIDPASGDILRIEAHLEHDMSDIGLKSLDIRVDYSRVPVSHSKTAANLPTTAVVEVATPRQHWRNTHAYVDYRGFSTDAVQEPNVVVKNAKPPDAPGMDGGARDQAEPKEKQ